MKAWRSGLAALGLAAVLAGTPAAAAETGVMVMSAGELGEPNGSVALLDLSSVQRAGDVVTASLAIVVLDPAASRVPGLSYMVGHQRISCRERTSQMTHVEVFAEEGVKLTEFNPDDPAEPVHSGSRLAGLMDRACRDAPLTPPGVQPFADIASGVAAVRASVDAAAAVRTDFAPHRYVLSRVAEGESGLRTPIFVDQALVEQEGGRPVRWLLMAHSRPATEDGAQVAYELIQMTFDCQANRAQVRVAMSIDPAGALAASSIELGPWAALEEQRELDLACGRGTESATTFTSIPAAMEYARSLGN